jgi:DNA ligase-1
MLNDIAKAIKEIQLMSSRNAKKNLLLKYKNLSGFKDVLHFIYNPYLKTNIAKKKLNKRKHDKVPQEHISIKQIIKYFELNQTGNDNDLYYAWQFINQQNTAIAKELAIAMITQNLKIGVSVKTLNDVYGTGFIPIIDCMLGKKYSDVKHKMKGCYIASKKIDGVRRLLIKENGNIRMYSRNGKLDTGLVDIIREAKHLPDNAVYDGELTAKGNFKNNLELRQATNSIANRKGVRTGLVFNIFDMIPVNEFKKGKSTFTAIVRKAAIASMFSDNDMININLSYLEHIKPVPILMVSSDLTVHERIFAEEIKRGGEGIMLVKDDSLYEVGKRSNNWVKMKRYEDVDLKVVDIEEGTGRLKDKLGAVIVDYRGNLVKVGSGFSDSERQRFWEKPSEIIGKTIEITHQGESKNKNGGISLNCPIFKGIRYDK